MLTPTEARQRLLAAAPPGTPWVAHSMRVAEVASWVGQALRDASHEIDLERVEIHALLHDLGRSRNHGPFHGWTGYCLLRAEGHADAGRGCLTHWLKGRPADELADGLQVSPAFVQRVLACLQPSEWLLTDSLMSFADASVAGDTIVPLEVRHNDLEQRYGSSLWLRRHAALSARHAADLSAALGRPVADLLAPHFGHLR